MTRNGLSIPFELIINSQSFDVFQISWIYLEIIQFFDCCKQIITLFRTIYRKIQKSEC